MRKEKSTDDKKRSKKGHKKQSGEKVNNVENKKPTDDKDANVRSSEEVKDNSKQNYPLLLDKLMNCKGFEQLRLKCKGISENFPELPTIPQSVNIFSSHLEVDADAMDLYPSDVPDVRALYPCTVPADGNCLPSSGSVYGYGCPDFSAEMRMRILCELVLNEETYLDDDFLHQGLPETEQGRSFAKSYAMYSDMWVPGMILNDAMIKSIYRMELYKIRVNYSYMGMWQIHALSSVLKAPIYSIYPEKGSPAVCRDLNRLVLPRHGSENMSPIYILWTSTRDSEMVCEHWRPNHFVPCLPVDDSSTYADMSQTISEVWNTENTENCKKTDISRETDDCEMETEDSKSVTEDTKMETEVSNETDNTMTETEDIKTQTDNTKVETEVSNETDNTMSETEDIKTQTDNTKVETEDNNKTDNTMTETEDIKTQTDNTKMETEVSNESDNTMTETADIKTETENDRMDTEGSNMGDYSEAEYREMETEDMKETAQSRDIKVCKMVSEDSKIMTMDSKETKTNKVETEDWKIETDDKTTTEDTKITTGNSKETKDSKDTEDYKQIETSKMESELNREMEEQNHLVKENSKMDITIPQPLQCIGKYVIVKYGKNAYPGIVEDAGEIDVFVKCMHGVGRKNSNRFYWPKKIIDRCWYDYENILAVIPEPTKSTDSHYKVEESVWESIIETLNQKD